MKLSCYYVWKVTSNDTIWKKLLVISRMWSYCLMRLTVCCFYYSFRDSIDLIKWNIHSYFWLSLLHNVSWEIGKNKPDKTRPLSHYVGSAICIQRLHSTMFWIISWFSSVKPINSSSFVYTQLISGGLPLFLRPPVTTGLTLLFEN